MTHASEAINPALLEAEAAAGRGDFESAERLLRDILSSQEASLGPVHPDVANTLNNLAVVCERLEKFDEAEQGYRRAHSIAVASLPPKHPFVATSIKNLVDFCKARGVPIWRPPLGAAETAGSSVTAPTNGTPASTPAAGTNGTSASATPAAALATALATTAATTQAIPAAPPAGGKSGASKKSKSAPAPLKPPAPIDTLAAAVPSLPAPSAGARARLADGAVAVRDRESPVQQLEAPPTAAPRGMVILVAAAAMVALLVVAIWRSTGSDAMTDEARAGTASTAASAPATAEPERGTPPVAPARRADTAAPADIDVAGARAGRTPEVATGGTRETSPPAPRPAAARAEAARLEAARVETARAEAARVEAARVEAARVEAKRVEAARAEAVRAETARAEAARAAEKKAAAAIPAPAPPTSSVAVSAAAAASGVKVLTADVCSALDRGRSPDWGCTSVGATATPGAISFYTRLSVATTTRVEHRWYYNGRLHQTMRLSIRPGGVSGYRTFSRNTVTPERTGDWRVELRTTEGVVLHEERFSVR